MGGSRVVYSSFSHSRPYTAESRSKYKGTLVREDTIGEEWEWGEEGEMRVARKDVATQTEPTDEFPPLRFTDEPHSTNVYQTTTEEPNVAQFRPSTVEFAQRQRSFSLDDEDLLFRPRSSITCQRFSQLYGFSRSDAMKQFHSQFPEPAPDLRVYGTQKGKRHTIHGYNSYYFH